MTTPILVLLNGIPGSGKSTIARCWAARRPSALVIDIDLVRATLPHWRDDPTAAGLLARAITLAAAREQLLVTGDVIIPQYLGRTEFLDQLDQLAADTGAHLHEVALMGPLEQAVDRFHRRPTDDPSAAQAATEVSAAGGVAELERMAERLERVIGARPSTVRLPSADTESLELITGTRPRASAGPRLIVLAGVPGTGKTTLSRALVAELGGVVLRVDAVENALAGHEVGALGYEICHLLAGQALALGATVVVDAVNPVPEARRGWRSLADDHDTPITMIETVLPDESEHRRRVEERRPDLPDQELPTWSEVHRNHVAWDEDRDGPRTVVDTTDRAEALRTALAAIS
ncbi:AAA family ATPase [Propionibacteriaceae bacterium Y1700]|uniref:AAA family ATPase n=1 Tax=Microlunatus sp. Y1700 TaxID=3418487 RepID=UPI003DA70D09